MDEFGLDDEDVRGRVAPLYAGGDPVSHQGLSATVDYYDGDRYLLVLDDNAERYVDRVELETVSPR